MEQKELVMALNGLAEILAQGNWVSIEDGLPEVDCENNQCKVTECVIAFSESQYGVGFSGFGSLMNPGSLSRLMKITA